jgi:hypothetical protein
MAHFTKAVANFGIPLNAKIKNEGSVPWFYRGMQHAIAYTKKSIQTLDETNAVMDHDASPIRPGNADLSPDLLVRQTDSSDQVPPPECGMC